MTRVAAIDCGTNSIRLLVADLDPTEGTLRDLERRNEIVRLGQGVDATGRLSDDALRRTFDACREYAEIIERLGARSVRFVATSATRDATNRDEFVAGVRDILGATPEVITGDEEAALSFAGATRELASVGSRVGFVPPALVVDLGGGSTEFVLGSETADAACSVDIGSVRLTERHFGDVGPTGVPSPEQVESARRDVDEAIASVSDRVPLGEAKTLIGLAGSVTTITAIALELRRYDPERIHHARISAAAVREVTDRLLSMSADQRRELPVMHPGRADVIAAGALILREIVERLGLPEVLVSEHDILDGLAWSQV